METYRKGSAFSAYVKLTANSLGYFTFEICNLDKFGQESETCFSENKLTFGDGSQKYIIHYEFRDIHFILWLPSNLVCEHCVLRWIYTNGNSWGACEDGTGRLGCGDQETFINCADISIIP